MSNIFPLRKNLPPAVQNHPFCRFGQKLFIIVRIVTRLVFCRDIVLHFQHHINIGEHIVSLVGTVCQSYFCPDVLVVGLPLLVNQDPNSPFNATQEGDLLKPRPTAPFLQSSQVKLEASPLSRVPPRLNVILMSLDYKIQGTQQHLIQITWLWSTSPTCP